MSKAEKNGDSKGYAIEYQIRGRSDSNREITVEQYKNVSTINEAWSLSKTCAEQRLRSIVYVLINDEIGTRFPIICDGILIECDRMTSARAVAQSFWEGDNPRYLTSLCSFRNSKIEWLSYNGRPVSAEYAMYQDTAFQHEDKYDGVSDSDILSVEDTDAIAYYTSEALYTLFYDTSQNEKTRLRGLKESASMGYPDAMTDLGRLLIHGHLPNNLVKQVNCRDSENETFEVHKDSLSITADKEEGIKLLFDSTKSKTDRSYYYYGRFLEEQGDLKKALEYYSDNTVPKGSARVFSEVKINNKLKKYGFFQKNSWLKYTAVSGNLYDSISCPELLFDLGTCFIKGEGTKKDYKYGKKLQNMAEYYGYSP
jgi:TPR repeat protein